MLAHQIFLYHQGRSRFDPRHLQKLLKLSRNPRFTGNISGLKLPHTPPPKPGNETTSESRADSDDSEDEDSDDEVDDIAKTMDSVLVVTTGD